MSLFGILEWVVWAISAAIAFFFVRFLRKDAKRGSKIHILQVFQTALMVCCITSFLFFSWNKFHLIWAMPACFFGAFLGFVLFPIPVIGTILNLITLAFARIIFLGTGADISGVLMARRPSDIERMVAGDKNAKDGTKK